MKKKASNFPFPPFNFIYPFMSYTFCYLCLGFLVHGRSSKLDSGLSVIIKEKSVVKE